MKRYVFFTNSIRNMGGAQMYLRNKLVFLKDHGWSTSVYFYNDGEVLIPELREFKNNCIRELAFPIASVRKKKRNRIIKRIAKELRGSDEIVIESHVYPNCYWMESIAEEIQARHILYILHESFPAINRNEADYLKFKLTRGEFMNSSDSIETCIGKRWENQVVFNMPSYSNVTAPLDYKLEYDKSLKTILSLGRLDKPYITPMLKEINAFTERAGLKVNLFLVGGAAEETYIDNIKDYMADKHLIIPYYFGYMFPVPECVIKTADVAIASSGSILVPTELGVPTIAIDTQDHMAMGIYGETTHNTFVRQSEPPINTSDLLYEVLVENKYNDIEAKPSEATIQAEIILQDHLKIIGSLDAPKEYYDVYSIYNWKEVLKQKMTMIAYKMFGENGIAKIAKMKNIIVGRNKR